MWTCMRLIRIKVKNLHSCPQVSNNTAVVSSLMYYTSVLYWSAACRRQLPGTITSNKSSKSTSNKSCRYSPAPLRMILFLFKWCKSMKTVKSSCKHTKRTASVLLRLAWARVQVLHAKSNKVHSQRSVKNNRAGFNSLQADRAVVKRLQMSQTARALLPLITRHCLLQWTGQV